MIATEPSSQSQSTAPEIEARITDAVNAALRSTGYVQLRDLNVRVDGHAVHLQGRLPSYYLKQIAHHVVLSLPVVHTIYDDIDVGS